jgi:hypothetical protein
MLTRSQAKKEVQEYIYDFANKKQPQPLYEVNIDFDEASEAWKSNKKYMGNGTYKYKCCGHYKNGKPCNRTATFDILDLKDDGMYCKIHKN